MADGKEGKAKSENYLNPRAELILRNRNLKDRASGTIRGVERMTCLPCCSLK